MSNTVSTAPRDHIVTLDHLSKIYKIYPKPRDRLVEALLSRCRHDTVNALDDVTFSLTRGRSLGLVGVNGAGKSTLLKVIAGTTFPTSGTVHVEGRVAAILELGMGFHGEFSGRDNAILNAAMMGLNQEEIQREISNIIAFTELGEVIDRPVKTYSSGMAMRLAFAVATHVNPDLLIIDEALAVGDGYFQKKCVDKIREFKKKGKSIILCTHALYYVAQLCDEALWIESGRIRMAGESHGVVTAYETYLNERKKKLPQQLQSGEGRGEELPARITELKVMGEGGEDGGSVEPGRGVTITVECARTDPSLDFIVGIVIDHSSGIAFFSSTTPVGHRDSREFSVQCRIPNLPFLKGEYDVTAFLMDDAGLSIFHQVKEEKAIKMDHASYTVGVLDIPHTWEER